MDDTPPRFPTAGLVRAARRRADLSQRQLADRTGVAPSTILDPRIGEWWGDRYGLARPPETFFRSRQRRDAQRARSRWEVRVAQTRHIVPPPPIVPDGRRGPRL